MFDKERGTSQIYWLCRANTCLSFSFPPFLPSFYHAKWFKQIFWIQGKCIKSNIIHTHLCWGTLSNSPSGHSYFHWLWQEHKPLTRSLSSLVISWVLLVKLFLKNVLITTEVKHSRASLPYISREAPKIRVYSQMQPMAYGGIHNGFLLQPTGGRGMHKHRPLALLQPLL